MYTHTALAFGTAGLVLLTCLWIRKVFACPRAKFGDSPSRGNKEDTIVVYGVLALPLYIRQTPLA